MKKYKRKMILATISLIFIFLTTIATTFAWVGIFTYASVSEFELNIKASDYNAQYFLKISPTGEAGTYTDSLDPLDVKKQVLTNFGKNIEEYKTENEINLAYQKYSSELEGVTTTVDENNKFTDFKKISYEGKDALGYNSDRSKFHPGMVDGSGNALIFDFYLTVDTKEGISDSTIVDVPVYMTNLEDTIESAISTHILHQNNFNSIDYSILNYPNLVNSIDFLKSFEVGQRIKVKAGNSARIGFEVYEPINIKDSYTDENKVVGNYIYQGGSNTPGIEDDGTYNLGGILPKEYNTSVQEIEAVRSYLDVIIPDSALNRNDRELVYGDDNKNVLLWNTTSTDKTSGYLGVEKINGVSTQTKIKIRTYIWFEGWDADCLLGISNQEVSFNLTFSADLD